MVVQVSFRELVDHGGHTARSPDSREGRRLNRSVDPSPTRCAGTVEIDADLQTVYWTVVDGGYRPVPDADEWLLHLRLDRDLAESTTESYTGSLALFLQWCELVHRDWRSAPEVFGRFVYWLQYYDPTAVPGDQVRIVRGPRRVNVVLTAVREFFRHCATVGVVEGTALTPLFDVVEDFDLPGEVRGGHDLRLRTRARHRLSEPERVVDAATDEEVFAMLKACRNARDRFIVLALWRVGHRRGELTGLRVEDVHFLPDAGRLGCQIRGEHLHIRRRDNVNGASAKSRRSRVVPADGTIVQAFDQYMLERNDCEHARRCDFVLVNLFRAPLGAPMRPGALNELLADLSRRAALSRQRFLHDIRALGLTLPTGPAQHLPDDFRLARKDIPAAADTEKSGRGLPTWVLQTINNNLHAVKNEAAPMPGASSKYSSTPAGDPTRSAASSWNASAATTPAKPC